MPLNRMRDLPRLVAGYRHGSSVLVASLDPFTSQIGKLALDAPLERESHHCQPIPRPLVSNGWSGEPPTRAHFPTIWLT